MIMKGKQIESILPTGSEKVKNIKNFLSKRNSVISKQKSGIINLILVNRF